MRFVNKDGMNALKEESKRILFEAQYGLRQVWDSRPRPVKAIREFVAETDRQSTGQYGDEEPLETEETN